MLDEVPERVAQTGGNEVGGVPEEDSGLFAGFRMTEGSLMKEVKRLALMFIPEVCLEGVHLLPSR